MNVDEVHADDAVLAPLHSTLIELTCLLLPQEYHSRQRDGYDQAQQRPFLRDVSDDAFDEAGLIDKEDLAFFLHLQAREGSAIVVQWPGSLARSTQGRKKKKKKKKKKKGDAPTVAMAPVRLTCRT